MNRYKKIFTFLCVVFIVSGCAGGDRLTHISVEGEVWSRGNAPFNAFVLTTDEQNHYVLVFDEENRPAMLSTPARYRVVGEIFVDTWAGQPFTHMRVKEAVVLD